VASGGVAFVSKVEGTDTALGVCAGRGAGETCPMAFCHGAAMSDRSATIKRRFVTGASCADSETRLLMRKKGRATTLTIRVALLEQASWGKQPYCRYSPSSAYDSSSRSSTSSWASRSCFASTASCVASGFSRRSLSERGRPALSPLI